MDVVALELDTRDKEAAHLKEQPFCRERAEGVAAMQAALQAVEARTRIRAAFLA